MFITSLILVLVGLLGFGWQRTWRSARSVRAVRWTRRSLMKLASAEGLDMRKSEVLVIVHCRVDVTELSTNKQYTLSRVIEDLVVLCAKTAVFRGFEGSQND